jgi:hypothetical protein
MQRQEPDTRAHLGKRLGAFGMNARFGSREASRTVQVRTKQRLLH